MATKKIKFGEFFSQRTKGEKTLGFMTAMIVFGALMYGFVIGPILDKINTIDTDISSTRDIIRRDRRILSFKHRIFEEYSKSNSYLDASQKSSEEIVATLLKKIESVSKDHSITIKDIRPGDTEMKPQFKVYKTSMDCEGTLADLLAMMTTLEQSDYLFQITRYTLAPKSKGADILKATFDIARYLIPAEKLDSSALEGLESLNAMENESVLKESASVPEFPEMPTS